MIFLGGCRQATDHAGVDRLLGLIRDRLDVMHDVARRKWADKSPIEDPAREAALLKDVEERGAELGLAPAETRAFFAAQIEAAKLVQQADFKLWETKGPEGEAPDLKTVLRPKIDALNRAMLATLAEPGAKDASLIRKRAEEILAGVDAKIRDVAIGPLVNGTR